MLPTKNVFLALALLLVTSSEVWGHGTITGVTGANGVQAAGFGIIASTPRDGTTRRPFQQDTSIIRDREITTGRTGVCGRTLAGGNNDVQSQLTAAVNAGLPSASSTGELTMTLHQINGDGAGPYTCDVSTDGGVTFQAATVTTNVPGNNGRSRAKATDFPLVMQVSPTTACKGGPSGNACVARCRNPAAAGPFGSCVAFTMGSNATSTDSATVSSTESAGASTTIAASGTDSAVVNTTSAAASATESVTITSTEESSAATSSTEAAAETTAIGGTSPSSEVVSTDFSSIETTAAGTSVPHTQATSPASAAAPAATGTEDEDEEEDSTNDSQSAENGQNAANTANTTPIKRMINSRIAGRMAGHWIDA